MFRSSKKDGKVIGAENSERVKKSMIDIMDLSFKSITLVVNISIYQD